MSKNIVNTNPADKIMEGLTILESAVGMTLGARARAVAVAKTNNQGVIYARDVLDDGVKVSRSIDLEDEQANMAVALIRESAQKQLDEYGDGTTATILLSCAIIRESLKQIAQGVAPMQIRAELESALPRLLKESKKLKIPVMGDEATRQIATISSKDDKLGAMISEVFKTMGRDGIVTIEESKSLDTKIDYQTGMRFDKGYMSPYFATDPETMRAVLENPFVLVTDQGIFNFLELQPFLEKFIKAKGNRPLVIIAPEFGGDALPSLIVNKVEGKFMSLCVMAPSFENYQKDMLNDIAILTGAKFITKDMGYKLDEISPDDLGQCSSVVSRKDSTTISGGAGKKTDVDMRVDQLRKQLKDAVGEFNREKLKERLAKLSQGVAVIKVGGQTEVEMRERKERVDDAVSATRAAIRGGITVGGEVAYLHLRRAVMDNTILKNALKAPFYTLLTNSGLDPAEVHFDIKSPPKNMGVDVTDGKIKDMIKSGIIDPLEVVQGAITNAISVAISIIITGAIITPIPPQK